MDDAEIARRFLFDFFSAGRDGSLFDAVSNNVRVAGVEGLDLCGRKELIRFHNMIWCQAEFLDFSAALVLKDAPWVSILGVVTLRERRFGAQTTDRLQVTFRILHGRIVEIIAFVDFLALFETIGRLPPRTLDRCIAGEVMYAT